MSFKLNVCNDILDKLSFNGGVVGICGYEMGYHISLTSSLEMDDIIPDAKLVYYNNCILINHVGGDVYLISKNEKMFPYEIISLFVKRNYWINKEVNWNTELSEPIKYDIVISKPESYTKVLHFCQE